MSPTFVLGCLALLCGLWSGAQALSFPDIFDDVGRQFAASDRAIKKYNAVHTTKNREVVRNELNELKAVQSRLIGFPAPAGLFTRLKQALRPLIDELVDEMNGILGHTAGRKVRLLG